MRANNRLQRTVRRTGTLRGHSRNIKSENIGEGWQQQIKLKQGEDATFEIDVTSRKPKSCRAFRLPLHRQGEKA